MMRRDRIPDFDVLRSLAILLLMVHHSDLYDLEVRGRTIGFLQPFLGAFIIGSFIFLAGYFSSSRLRVAKGKELTAYLRSRFTRIYPPYLFALGSFILLLDIGLERNELIAHVLGLQIFLAPLVGRPVFTLWFVGLILIFFFIFSFLQIYLKTNLGLGLAVPLVYLASLYLNVEFNLFEYRYFIYFPIFAVGIFCERTGVLDRFYSARYRYFDKIALAIFGVIMLSLAVERTNKGVVLFRILATDLFILTMLLLVLSLLHKFQRSMSGLRIFFLISSSSYFAFLFHRPIWALMTNFETFPSEFFRPFYKIILGAPLILVLSYFLQKAYKGVLDRRV